MKSVKWCLLCVILFMGFAIGGAWILWTNVGPRLTVCMGFEEPEIRVVSITNEQFLCVDVGFAHVDKGTIGALGYVIDSDGIRIGILNSLIGFGEESEFYGSDLLMISAKNIYHRLAVKIMKHEGTVTYGFVDVNNGILSFQPNEKRQ